MNKKKKKYLPAPKFVVKWKKKNLCTWFKVLLCNTNNVTLQDQISMRVTNINEDNTPHTDINKVFHSGPIMKCHHIFQSTRWTQLFQIWKFIFWLQHQFSLKQDRKIDWKNYWCSLEMLRVSFMSGDQSKHQLHFFTLTRPITPPPHTHTGLPISQSQSPQCNFIDCLQPNWQNSLTAKSPCLYIILIISSTNVIRTCAINFQCNVILF